MTMNIIFIGLYNNKMLFEISVFYISYLPHLLSYLEFIFFCIKKVYILNIYYCNKIILLIFDDYQ